MTAELSLSVLDQSPIRFGGSVTDALRESITLAQITERLGYRRYWVAEHHNSNSFACTTPELLISQIAAGTKEIRVGSGGVMMLNYSALKVAEQFRVLEALYPGRIELGIGRAAGADPLTASALSYPRSPVPPADFRQQVADLLGYLHGDLGLNHPFVKVRAQPGPTPDSCPDIWLLGSSQESMKLAAELGLPFAFADFLCTTRDEGFAVAETYRRIFRPSAQCKEPRFSVAFDVICAPTSEEARSIALSRNFDRVAQAYGVQGLLPPDEVLEYELTEDVLNFMESWAQTGIEGDPSKVREVILNLAAAYGTSDISILTNCYGFADRTRSYELLAGAFGLQTAR